MQVSEHAYAPSLIQPRHAHTEAGFSLVLAGSLRERVGAREEFAGPLAIVVKPPDTEHADAFGAEGARLVRISLTAEEAAGALTWAPLLRQWHWTHCGPATHGFLALVCALRHPPGGGPNPVRLERLAWDTLAALATRDTEAARREPPAWLLRVRQALDDSAVPPRLGELAALAGVHPVYLARQFRRFFGCAVSGYVHRLRVRRAAASMARPDVSLSRAALDAGFCDQPHLCRIFRRETGMTPRRYRSLAIGVPLVQDDAPHAR